MRAVDLCSVLDIEMLPTNVARNRDRQTHAGRSIEKLIENYGAGHATVVLRTIIESIGNETELRAEIIWSISDIILARPDWVNRGLAFIEAFDDINLKALRAKAKALKIPCPSRFRLGVLLHERLARTFDAAQVGAGPRIPAAALPDAQGL
jgi:hypothetical protein